LAQPTPSECRSVLSIKVGRLVAIADFISEPLSIPTPHLVGTRRQSPRIVQLTYQAGPEIPAQKKRTILTFVGF